MTSRLFLLFFLSCISLRSLADEIVFEMSVFGIRFGTMVLTRSMENDSTELFTLHAKGKTDFLWMQREEESKYEVRYRNGKLFSSDYIYLNKGETEKWTNVKQEGSGYLVESSEGSKLLKQVADYSLLKLYFEPTWDRQKVFCEEDCSYAELIGNPEKGTLKVLCQDGSRSTYHVKNGQISELEIHLAVATVTLTRIN
ncbi:MAG: hypothetical protein GC178_15410 [Flavobacteriales bacterium]|nr:hypothetical protein [Flavobacteriales bacterium]